MVIQISRSIWKKWQGSIAGAVGLDDLEQEARIVLLGLSTEIPIGSEEDTPQFISTCLKNALLDIVSFQARRSGGAWQFEDFSTIPAKQSDPCASVDMGDNLNKMPPDERIFCTEVMAGSAIKEARERAGWSVGEYRRHKRNIKEILEDWNG